MITYHVVPTDNGRWGAKRPEASRYSRTFDHRHEAVDWCVARGPDQIMVYDGGGAVGHIMRRSRGAWTRRRPERERFGPHPVAGP